MVYDVLIDNTIYKGIAYAELISLPLEPTTLLRRNSSNWMNAADCVELTHILAQRSYSNPTPSPQEHSEPTFISHESNDANCNNDNHVEIPNAHAPHSFTAPSSTLNPNENVVEERIFIPNAEYFKCKQKRKAAIIGVCTLGLAGLSMIGVGNTWRSNIFAGTSFSANEGIGFVLKCLSFCLLTVLIAIPYFIYSVIALVYYSIRMSNLRN